MCRFSEEQNELQRAKSAKAKNAAACLKPLTCHVIHLEYQELDFVYKLQNYVAIKDVCS